MSEQTTGNISPALKTTPFFSVCTITYNRASFLMQMIPTVLGQSFENFEFIIVDDGSTDNTGEVVASFKDPRLCYYKKAHTNAPDSRNACIANATGEFIVWMDSDDELLADALKIHYQNITSHPEIAVSYGNVRTVMEDGQFIRDEVFENWYGREAEMPREMLLANLLPNGSSAIRRSVFGEIGGYNVQFTRAHDYEFWTRLAGNYKVRHCGSTLLHYRCHSTNMSTVTVSRDTSFEERIILGIVNSQGMQKLFPEFDWSAPVQQDEKANIYYLLAGRMAGLERWERALLFAEQSLKLFPLDIVRKLQQHCIEKQNHSRKSYSLNGVKILVVVHSFVPHRFAGVENYVFAICKEFLQYGAQVHAFYPVPSAESQEPFLRSGVYEGVITHQLFVHTGNEFANHINNDKINNIFQQLITQEKFSLIHFHHTLSLSFSLIDIAKNAKIPVAMTLHDSWYMCLRVHLFKPNEKQVCTGPESVEQCAACFYEDEERLQQMREFLHHRNDAGRKVLRQADIVSAPSAFLAQKYQQYKFCEQIVIQPLGLPDIQVPARKANTRVKIGFLGSIQPLKNIDTLLKAFSQLTDTAELHLYANGEDEQMKELYSKAGSLHGASYHGSYQYHEIGSIFANLDFVVVPSLIESYSLVVREALTCGIPVIASNRGGIPEIVQHGINGFLFEPEDTESLTRLMSLLIRDEKLRRQLQRACRPSMFIYDDARNWANRYLTLLAAKPKVSIVIPCYNKVEFTKQCLQSLYTHTPTTLFEVIAVDNASTDETMELLKTYELKYSNFRFIRNEENIGFAKGNNQAARLARAAYVLLLNNDTEVQSGWIEPMINTLENDPFVGAVGAKLLYPDGTIQHAGVGIVHEAEREFPMYPKHVFCGMASDTPNANVARSQQAVTAACIMVRTELYQQLNGLDEAYWNGYEDMDFCFRLREAGYKIIYNPAAVLTHHESQSGPERFSKARENMVRLHERWNDSILPDFVVEASGVRETAQVITGYQPYKKASIVIPLYNNVSYTKECYESIKKYTTYPYEVIFVDNASTDDTETYLQNLLLTEKNVKVVVNKENVGFPGAVNAGLKEGTGDYLVIANNDILFTPLWLEKLINLAEANPQIGITGPVSNFVSGVQIQKDAIYQDTEGMYRYAEQLARQQRGKYAIFPRVAFLCTLIKRELFEKIGGLDERFAPGNFEDDDYCLRAQLAGYATAIAKDVFIHHYGSKSFLAQGQKKYEERLKVNHKKFVQKWGADPDELWLRGKKPGKHSIVYPLSKDVVTEITGRLNVHIEDGEYHLALEVLKKLTDMFENGILPLSSEQVQPFYQLRGKLEQLNVKVPLQR